MKKQTWIKIVVLCAIIAAILVTDLVSKYVLDASLEYGEEISIIPYLFNFKLIYNIGAAWGVLSGKQVFLIVLTFVFLAIFIFYYVKDKEKPWLLTMAFSFLIGGCLGNLIDRLFIGYVRDFIQFAFWKSFPVFNFADVFLCVGVVLFIIYLIIYFVRNRKKSPIVVEKETKSTKKDEKNNDFSETHAENLKNLEEPKSSQSEDKTNDN